MDTLTTTPAPAYTIPVKAKYKAPAAVTAPIGQVAAEAAKRFAEAKAEIKRLEEFADEQEAVIREALGEANVGTFMGVKVVKLAYRNPTRISADLLKEVYPEAYVMASYDSPYTFIQVL